MEPVLKPPPGFYHGSIKDECYETSSNVSRKTSGKTKCSLPVEDYTLYAAVVIDDEGEISYRTSQSLKSGREELLKDVADQLEAIWNMRQQRKNGGHGQQAPTQKGSKRSGSPTFANSPVTQVSSPIPSSSLRLQKRRRFGDRQVRTEMSMVHSTSSKQHGLASQAECSNVVSAGISKPLTPGFTTPPMRQIEVQETEAITAWMREAFAAVQQQACRLLAKEWIKVIQPKKQSTNPYNGKRAGMENPSPELTKPLYWPPSVEHKEPDHLKSPGRTTLLTHLMMHTPQKEIKASSSEGTVFGKKEFYARDLCNVLDWDKSSDLKSKKSIIENIVVVRGLVEAFNEGGIDATTSVTVPCYREKPRKKLDNKKQVVDLEETKAGEVATMQPKVHDMVNLADSTWDQMTNLSNSEGTSPFDSSETPPASDEQDQAALLNMSFTSTATGLSSALSSSSPPSSLQVGQASRTTLDCHPNHTAQARRGTVILDDTGMQVNGANYSQHTHSIQGHPAWTSGLALPADSFPNEDLMTLLHTTPAYNTGLCVSQQNASMLSTMPPPELHDPQNYSSYYVNSEGRIVPYRVVHDLSDPMQAGHQGFSAPTPYYAPQYQHQPQHIRHQQISPSYFTTPNYSDATTMEKK